VPAAPERRSTTSARSGEPMSDPEGMSANF
jgi:hypothetical protein